MHALFQLVLEVVLVAAVALIFTLMMVKRPGAAARPSRQALVLYFVVGLVIAVVFLATRSLYVQNNVIG